MCACPLSFSSSSCCPFALIVRHEAVRHPRRALYNGASQRGGCLPLPRRAPRAVAPRPCATGPPACALRLARPVSAPRGTRGVLGITARPRAAGGAAPSRGRRARRPRGGRPGLPGRFPRRSAQKPLSAMFRDDRRQPPLAEVPDGLLAPVSGHVRRAALAAGGRLGQRERRALGAGEERRLPPRRHGPRAPLGLPLLHRPPAHTSKLERVTDARSARTGRPCYSTERRRTP